MTAKKKPQRRYSLDHIASAMGYMNLNAMYVSFPQVLQEVFSTNKTAIEFDYDGSLIKSLDDLLALIDKANGHLLIQTDETYMYSWKHSYCSVVYRKNTNQVCLSGYATDPKLLALFEKISEEFITTANNNLAYVIVKRSDRLSVENLGTASCDFIEQNYNQQVIEDIKYVISSYTHNPPKGRITILTGVPGTGKTHLIRSILSKLDSVFLIIPSNMADALDKPELMPLLIDLKGQHEKPIILVIEDGDICLVPRENDNISTITSLLNLSDGILGTILDIRLIISTNAKIKDMDEAILRPGRLCRQISVDSLSYDQANQIYQRLCENSGAMLDYRPSYTLAEIYAVFNSREDMAPTTNVGVKRVIGFSPTASTQSDNLILNRSTT